MARIPWRRPALRKPYTEAELLGAVTRLLDTPSTRPPDDLWRLWR